MPAAFHDRGHIDPACRKPERFKLRLEQRADLFDAGEIFSGALNVYSFFKQRDRVSGVRIDVGNDLLFFRRDFLRLRRRCRYEYTDLEYREQVPHVLDLRTTIKVKL